MSFRVSALVAVVGVLALSSVAPAFGQPIAPQRPRSTPFGAIFSPPVQQQQLQQQLIINQAMGGRGIGPGLFGPGLGNPFFGAQQGLGVGPLAYQAAFPGAFTVDPLLTPTGIVGSFGNYGHWYPNLAAGGAGGGLSGNYGHWYPGGVGVSGGRGVLGAGGGGGGLYAGAPVFVGGTGGGVGPRGGSSLIGAGVGGGMAVNQFRR